MSEAETVATRGWVVTGVLEAAPEPVSAPVPVAEALLSVPVAEASEAAEDRTLTAEAEMVEADEPALETAFAQ